MWADVTAIRDEKMQGLMSHQTLPDASVSTSLDDPVFADLGSATAGRRVVPFSPSQDLDGGDGS